MFSLARGFAPLLRLFLYSKLIFDSQNHQDDLVSSQLPHCTSFKYISVSLCNLCASDLRPVQYNSSFLLAAQQLLSQVSARRHPFANSTCPSIHVGSPRSWHPKHLVSSTPDEFAASLPIPALMKEKYLGYLLLGAVTCCHLAAEPRSPRRALTGAFALQVSRDRGADLHPLHFHFLCHDGFGDAPETQRTRPGQQWAFPLLLVHHNAGPHCCLGDLAVERQNPQEEVPWRDLYPRAVGFLHPAHEQPPRRKGKFISFDISE